MFVMSFRLDTARGGSAARDSLYPGSGTIGTTCLELLFNLVWIAVAIYLWGSWLLSRRDGRKRSRLCAFGAKAIPLAVLTVILLPAISITDDLHACQFPAEIKRSEFQSDRHIIPAAPPVQLHFAVALLAFWMTSQDSRSSYMLQMEPPARLATCGHFRTLWCRPPPAVA